VTMQITAGEIHRLDRPHREFERTIETRLT